MRKLVLNVALFTTGIFTTFNKVEAQKGLQIGFEANPQLSYLVSADDMDSKLYAGKSAVNGHFGFSGQYGFTEKMGIGLNVLYSFQGSLYEWQGVEQLKSLQYLKIPLMFTLNLPINDKICFVGKIGPQLNILTDARLYNADRKLIENNYTTAFADFDFGGMISSGFAYKLNDRLSVDGAVRFDTGFTDAENKDYKLNIHDPSDLINPSPASSPRGNTYNMTIGLTFGVRYTFL